MYYSSTVSGLIMNLDLVIEFHFYANIVYSLQIKAFALLFIRLSVYPNPSFFAWS